MCVSVNHLKCSLSSLIRFSYSLFGLRANRIFKPRENKKDGKLKYWQSNKAIEPYEHNVSKEHIEHFNHHNIVQRLKRDFFLIFLPLPLEVVPSACFLL